MVAPCIILPDNLIVPGGAGGWGAKYGPLGARLGLILVLVQRVEIIPGDMWRTSGLHGSVRLVKLASTKLARAHHLWSGVESDRKCVNK